LRPRATEGRRRTRSWHIPLDSRLAGLGEKEAVQDRARATKRELDFVLRGVSYQSMSPVIRQQYLAARRVLERYRRAEVTYGLILALTILLAVILIASSIPAIVALLLPSAAVLGYLYFFPSQLNRLYEINPFLCRCEGSDLSAENGIRRAWVCGFCGQTHPPFNFQPWRRTLLERCKNCHRLQHSVLCYRCDKPIIWNENAYSPGTSAWYLDYPPLAPEPPVPEGRSPTRISKHLH
jgi:hypothetical protein